jgi:enolase
MNDEPREKEEPGEPWDELLSETFREALECASGFAPQPDHYFFDGTVYRLEDTPDGIDADGLIRRLERMTLDYPILSIEDGLAEDDWEGGP